MRLLIDESLSRRVALGLVSEAHDAVHVVDIGLRGAHDAAIMDEARRPGRVVVSADTDFGDLLALGSHTSPSVLLLRRSPHNVDAQVALLCACFDAVGTELEHGAIAVVSPGRVRIRPLPIVTPDDQ